MQLSRDRLLFSCCICRCAFRLRKFLRNRVEILARSSFSSCCLILIRILRLFSRICGSCCIAVLRRVCLTLHQVLEQVRHCLKLQTDAFNLGQQGLIFMNTVNLPRQQIELRNERFRYFVTIRFEELFAFRRLHSNGFIYASSVCLNATIEQISSLDLVE